MKYVLLIIYSSMSGSGWGTTKFHAEYESMKECQLTLSTWRSTLGNKIISGQCYYQSPNPLPGDCRAWGEFEKKWTNTCLAPGNDVKKQCQMLENPPTPYNKCKN